MNRLESSEKWWTLYENAYRRESYNSCDNSGTLIWTKRYLLAKISLHKMYVFFDKSSNVRFHPSVFERFWSEPLISNKPFFFPGPRLWFTGIFYEKEWDFFVDHWRSFEIGCRERIVDCIHKFDDTEIRFCKSCFFRNLTKRCFHWGFIIFNIDRKSVV